MTTTLITGANKGLGFETARRLVAAGHTVYIGSRDRERGHRAAEQLGARAVLIDVTDDSSVAAAAKTVDGDGGLDVLINNAGIEIRAADDTVIGAADVTADTIPGGLRNQRLRRGQGDPRVSAATPTLPRAGSGQRQQRPRLPDASRINRRTRPPLPGCRLPGLQDGGQHDHRAVRQGIPEHADQRRRTWLHRNRSQRPQGTQTVEDGAETIVRMAQVAQDGPTGGSFDVSGPLPW